MNPTSTNGPFVSLFILVPRAVLGCVCLLYALFMCYCLFFSFYVKNKIK